MCNENVCISRILQTRRTLSFQKLNASEMIRWRRKCEKCKVSLVLVLNYETEPQNTQLYKSDEKNAHAFSVFVHTHSFMYLALGGLTIVGECSSSSQLLWGNLLFLVTFYFVPRTIPFSDHCHYD